MVWKFVWQPIGCKPLVTLITGHVPALIVVNIYGVVVRRAGKRRRVPCHHWRRGSVAELPFQRHRDAWCRIQDAGIHLRRCRGRGPRPVNEYGRRGGKQINGGADHGHRAANAYCYADDCDGTSRLQRSADYGYGCAQAANRANFDGFNGRAYRRRGRLCRDDSRSNGRFWSNWSRDN